MIAKALQYCTLGKENRDHRMLLCKLLKLTTNETDALSPHRLIFDAQSM